MYIEKKFVRNYLSKANNNSGQLAGLVFVTICMLVSYISWNNIGGFEQFLSANPLQVFEQKEYWRLFTTTLVHGDLKHLLANSFMLFILTYFVTSFFGVIYSLILAFLMGGVVNAFTLSLYTENTTLIGASGVLYYLWGFWLILYIGIETQRSLISRLLRTGAVFFILLVPTSYNPHVSYVAHYSGFILGAFVGLIYYLFKRKKFKNFEIWEENIVNDEEEETLEEFTH